MSYRYAYNTRDIKFILKEWLPMDEVLSWDRYKDYYSKDDIDPIVDQVRKVAEDIVAPTADDADKIGARWEDGKVYIPPSFHKAIKFLQEQGWGASTFDFEAEGGVPLTMYFLLWEMLSAANPGMMSYVSNGGAVANVIYHYAQDFLKEMFLPNLYAGTWGGSMCLTEPSIGSDTGFLLTKAIPTDDPRIYKIKGQKIFITVADRDDIDQVIHLVLARVEGAAPGTKGLSLFITPKQWINEDGSFSPNDVQTAGIEHKMGLKGSATCQLVFGEENNCRGWLMGPAPDENGVGMGIVQMFNMMNEARLDTGRLSLAVTANAYWNAKDYGKDRVQGNLLTDPKGPKVTINQHEDVKRMYLLNKATTEACRALLAKCYYYEDAREFSPTPESRKAAQDKLDMLTPLCKAYPSDEAWGLIGESLQSYGGYGFCEDYPAANSARDCKIWSIWEGTNYIQSLDLIGRKWTQKKGALFASILGEIDTFLAENKGKMTGLEKEMANLEKALKAYRELQMTVFGYMQGGKISLMATYARRILTATSQVYCGYLLLDQAKIALARMEELGPDHFDYNFYLGKVFSARYYLNNAVPNVWHVLELVQMADTSVMEAPVEIFEY